MNNHSPVAFKFGDESAYQNLQNKDGNTIYFTSDNDGNRRLYVGTDCYNVTVVTNIDPSDSSIMDNKKVPSVPAVISALNQKVNRCQLINSTVTTIPAVITLANNTEYRYLNITAPGPSTITVSIPQDDTPYLYYSSVIIHNINCADTVVDFVNIDINSDVQEVKFLNGDAGLGDMDTVELLFFSNGLDVCCIAATYKHEEEPQP